MNSQQRAIRKGHISVADIEARGAVRERARVKRAHRKPMSELAFVITLLMGIDDDVCNRLRRVATCLDESLRAPKRGRRG